MNETTTTNVTVGFVNPPKQGKRNGTIKTTDDVLFLAKPPILALFQQGGQYKITYETYSIGGNTFKEIKDVQSIATPDPAARPAGHGGYRQDDAVAERIFVCGLINASMNNPNVKPLEITGQHLLGMVNLYRKVWAGTFGKPSPLGGGEPKHDMDDEIPF